MYSNPSRTDLSSSKFRKVLRKQRALPSSSCLKEKRIRILHIHYLNLGKGKRIADLLTSREHILALEAFYAVDRNSFCNLHSKDVQPYLNWVRRHLAGNSPTSPKVALLGSSSPALAQSMHALISSPLSLSILT